jgi:hypothetical protein
MPKSAFALAVLWGRLRRCQSDDPKALLRETPRLLCKLAVTDPNHFWGELVLL